MKNTEKYTDKDWEDLASHLSNEQAGSNELYERFSSEDSYNTEGYWRKLGKHEKDDNINIDPAWNSVYNKIRASGLLPETKQLRIGTVRSYIVRIAAISLILLSLGTTAVLLKNLDFLNKNITLSTNEDQKNLLIDLPDGSKIFLNRNTELSYSSNFGKYNRQVKLQGEAFFEISPDTDKPFVIDAGKANIKVVGTSFNVISDNPESAVEVYVKSGKVLLTDNSGTNSLLLEPESIGTIDSNSSMKTINQNPNYLSWNTGYLDYNGQKLEIVFHDLKRVYNMDIIADDPSILDYQWTSPIDNESQDTIIRLICGSFNLSYSKDGNVYHLTKN